MRYRIIIYLLFLLLTVLIGCGTHQITGCEPVLMPYIEYGYKAEPKELSGIYVSNNEELLDFHGLNMAVPPGWSHEEVFSGMTLKFFNVNGLSFIVSYKANTDVLCDSNALYTVGCKKFNVSHHEPARSKKEFYTDLYSFTDDQVTDNPTFWQYYILWAKTKFLRDVGKLIHYTGENLEAFQRNSKLEHDCAKGGVVMQSEIFPRQIAPDYLSIASGFKDDAFFVEFFEMLNAMNQLNTSVLIK